MVKVESAKPQTYIGLDIVRFLAALSVAVYHLGYWFWLPHQTDDSLRRSAFDAIADPARWGFIGVPVFFVLSGFIIAASAMGRTAPSFLKARALRLYPAAWLATLILVPIQQTTDGLGFKILGTLTLWPTGPWLSGVFWTLGVEIVFYLLVALSIWRGVRLMTLGTVLGLASAAFWLGRSLDFVTGGHFKALFSAVETSLAGGFLVLPMCYFAVGITLWSLKDEGSSKAKLSFLGLFILASLADTFSAGRYWLATNGGPGSALEAPAIWLAALALIVASIWLQPLIWRHFSRLGPFARFVGLATYPLYLIHSELGKWLMLHSSRPPWPSLILSLALTIAVACAIVLLEPWPRSALRSVLSARPKSAPGVAR
ncbi:MAG: acyltransferase 3 protein [Bradyrhizobium sp.]|nr:acyltransferase 3 protein [Bradyrhizobium sp.]